MEELPALLVDRVRRVELIADQAVTVVLDGGASEGQWAAALRADGYAGRIVSFEPLEDAFRTLAIRALADPAWEAHRLALGDADGDAVMNVAANSWSSSLLRMGARHLSSAPESAYVGTEAVPVARLDSLRDELLGPVDRVYLKLDVQGYELPALAGAAETLAQAGVVEAELSLVPLYEGQAPPADLVRHLAGRGFELVAAEPGFADPQTGELLQVDGIFVRS